MNRHQLNILFRYWRICFDRANRYAFHIYTSPDHGKAILWQRKTVKAWKLYQHYGRIYDREHGINKKNTPVRVQTAQGDQHAHQDDN